MTKKGFTLMELLVSIFISGMVMLSLVAMWKTSSNHTAQAQRQSIIKNDNTIFLRKFFMDFIASSEVVCPASFTKLDGDKNPCISNLYIAIKNARVDAAQETIIRTTNPVCGDGGKYWGIDDIEGISSRCVRPNYVAYRFNTANNNLYRCQDNFLTDTTTVGLTNFINNVSDYCTSEHWEIIMPYVSTFALTIPVNSGGTAYPELLLDYAILRDFGPDIPPVYFKFKRFFTKKKGG